MNPFESSSKLVQDFIKSEKLPSAALAIGVRDKLYIKEATGNISFTEEASSVNTSTLYDLASLTKITVTTSVIMKLLDRGEISLEQDLGTFFPAPIDKRFITLRNLLTHTAGFPSVIRLENEIKSPDQALKCLLKTPLVYSPGTKVLYDDISFMLLGFVLEKIYKQSLAEIAESEVFLPLKMKNTAYHASGTLSPNTAFTERDHITGKWLRGTVHDENARFLNGVAGHAGVFSNIEDMAKFVSVLASNGRNGNQPFISSTTLRSAYKNYTKSLNENRGLGFALTTPGVVSLFDPSFDLNTYGHTGFTGTSFSISPKTGLFTVLLTNRVHPTRENNNHILLRKLLKQQVQEDYLKHFR